MEYNATIVYGDVLGFSQLVSRYEWAIDNIPDGARHASFSEAEVNRGIDGEPRDALSRLHVAFHRTLGQQMAAWGVFAGYANAIVFSDSFFAVFRDFRTAVIFAQDCMRALIRARVPVRMGLGRGTYKAVRFTTDLSDSVHWHSAQFLGTAVLRAHAAEACGLKGLPIFVHPDTQVQGLLDTDLVEVAAGIGAMKVAVRQEVNFMHPWVRRADMDEVMRCSALKSNDDLMLDISEMAAQSKEHSFQYDATLDAVGHGRYVTFPGRQ